MRYPLKVLAAFAVGLAPCIVPSASAQPEYLIPLLRDIATQKGIRFTDALVRVQERAIEGVYTQDDLRHLVRALVARADQSPEVRSEIITALGQIGLPESVPVIMRYARTGDATVRLSAYQALGWIGDPRALPLIDSARAGLSGAPADTQMALMLEYAARAIALKHRLRAVADREERLALIRTTLYEEPNWLVRGDLVRQLRRWPDERVWPLLFEARARWTGPPAYFQQIRATIADRYRFNPTGFIVVLRQRPADERLFGLRAIEEVASSADMGALMDMAETDPDKRVRELAGQVLSRLLNR